jgi:hypothetical protein
MDSSSPARSIATARMSTGATALRAVARITLGARTTLGDAGDSIGCMAAPALR